MNKIILQSGGRPSREGTRLVCAGGTGYMMCPSDGQQKYDRTGQAVHIERRGQRK